MPAFNAENTITDSVNSILKQTYQDFRLYIINDFSQDNTKEIISKFTDYRITVIHNEKNLGVAQSRNKAISRCNGKYIAFLDSDDLWEPEKLEKQLDALTSGWDVVCSNYSTFKPNGDINIRCSPQIITYNDMLHSCYIGNLTGIYHAEKIGKFLQKRTGAEDYLMWLSILKKTHKAYCIQETLAKYRISELSLSGNKFTSAKWQWNIYRNELNFNILKSIYYFSHYAINALLKRI
ncbi:glycosyltransferase family 2 protein [Providencia rettgeri]|nr:glycosyltransferase family 2 protein [Providencia rettgeri]MBS0874976.1 glycosyltransferase family 2 protein [Providencia rettgeri]MBS0921884.1 glycosyltransferase family 2 protein [Providencia rettgeri]